MVCFELCRSQEKTMCAGKMGERLDRWHSPGAAHAEDLGRVGAVDVLDEAVAVELRQHEHAPHLAVDQVRQGEVYQPRSRVRRLLITFFGFFEHNFEPFVPLRRSFGPLPPPPPPPLTSSPRTH